MGRWLIARRWGCGLRGFSWGARILSALFDRCHVKQNLSTFQACSCFKWQCVHMCEDESEFVCSHFIIQVRVNAFHFCIRQVFLICTIWLKRDRKKIHQQKYTQVAIILCPQHLCCAISKLSLSGATTTPFNSHRDAVLSGRFLFLLF